MLQRLPIFLEENKAKLLIKYDGERRLKKYTVRLLFNNVQRNSVGKDTDSPLDVLRDVLKKSFLFSDEEIINFYFNTIDIGIEDLKKKMGNNCIVSIIIEEREGGIVYILHIETTKGVKHASGRNYLQLVEKLLLIEVE